MTSIAAKAQTITDRSSSIVVSFHARWLPTLVDRSVRAVIRKRVPRDPTGVEWLYAYVTAPVCAFVARAEVLSIERLKRKRDAYDLAQSLCLTRLEIDDYYIGQSSDMGLYRLGRIDLATKPVQLSETRKSLIFHPPQSFLFLSVAGERLLRRLTDLEHVVGSEGAI